MQSDEQQIRRLVQTWMEATKANDGDTVLSLMSDDVVFLVTGRPPMVGKEAFAAAMEAQMEAQAGQEAPDVDATSEIEELEVLGDWAFMRSKLTVVMTPPGGAEPIRREGYTLTIFKKENGRWLLARDANMLAPVPIQSEA